MSLSRETIIRMFARRPFTISEHKKIKKIYTDAKILALHINQDVPDSIEKDLAILKIKDALASCEVAVAMNPSEGDAMAETGPMPPMKGQMRPTGGCHHFNGA